MAITDRRQGVVGSVAIKAPCRVATTGNITLSGEQAIDGVAVVTDDRVLVRAQTDATLNGVYSCDTGGWSRTTDFDGANDVVQGTIVAVVSGTLYNGTVWQLTTSDPDIDTDSLTFEIMGRGRYRGSQASFRPCWMT